MASSSEFNEALDPDTAHIGNHFPVCDRLSETSRSMRVLERLAATLGVSVESFFAETGPGGAATTQEITDLMQAFVAISDPVMRRYCLDVVRAAGAQHTDEDRRTLPV